VDSNTSGLSNSLEEIKGVTIDDLSEVENYGQQLINQFQLFYEYVVDQVI
jgi:hypothetical protein